MKQSCLAARSTSSVKHTGKPTSLEQMMIAIKNSIAVSTNDGVTSYLERSSLTGSDEKEFAFRDKLSQASRSNYVDRFDDIVFKAEFIRAFRRLISRLDLAGTERILEMGAGHGWASVLVKQDFPNCFVVASDLVPTALHFCANYEQILNVCVDEKWAFSCRDIPFENNTFDRVFTMAAFHHFGREHDFSETLNEMIRILKPDGKIVLLYEPSAPRFLYSVMYRIVNSRRARDDVDEDILVISDIENHCKKLGCDITIEYYPDHRDRSGISSKIYYYAISKLRILLKFTVCCVNITIKKRVPGIG